MYAIPKHNLQTMTLAAEADATRMTMEMIVDDGGRRGRAEEEEEEDEMHDSKHAAIVDDC